MLARGLDPVYCERQLSQPCALAIVEGVPSKLREVIVPHCSVLVTLHLEYKTDTDRAQQRANKMNKGVENTIVQREAERPGIFHS